MIGRAGRSGATWLMLALAAGLAALPVVSATRSVLTAAGVWDVDDALVRRSALAGVFGEQQVRTAEMFSTLISVPVAVAAVVLLVGLITWRGWAREAALGVCGLGGALLVVFSVAGMAGQARHGVRGLLVGAALLAVAGLAVSAPVGADFDRRRIAREVQERERRTRERRARSG